LQIISENSWFLYFDYLAAPPMVHFIHTESRTKGIKINLIIKFRSTEQIIQEIKIWYITSNIKITIWDINNIMSYISPFDTDKNKLIEPRLTRKN